MRFQEMSRIEIVSLFISGQQSRLVSQHVTSRLSYSPGLNLHVFTGSIKGLLIPRFSFQGSLCTGKQKLKMLADSVKCWHIMSNDFLALTSTLISRKHLSSVQSYPKLPASFQNRLSCFSLPRYLCSNGKIYPANTQAYSSTFHKRNSVESLLFFKTVFCF